MATVPRLTSDRFSRYPVTCPVTCPATDAGCPLCRKSVLADPSIFVSTWCVLTARFSVTVHLPVPNERHSVWLSGWLSAWLSVRAEAGEGSGVRCPPETTIELMIPIAAKPSCAVRETSGLRLTLVGRGTGLTTPRYPSHAHTGYDARPCGTTPSPDAWGGGWWGHQPASGHL
ncbi:hypothetical protein WN48_00611 [Eufriesea mexicana]|uniref:Uncharacterized protein n=1 Tax=Eufriesea mexicana TaxID=516756 RepID=A0A310SEC2_9HYME|nr:hypothetical protein WN48_00611 [Eufriesea mexicana]